MSSGRIERWITTDEGNHLPIIDGRISPNITNKKANESAFLEGLTGKKQESAPSGKLSNKKTLVDYVKTQTGVDLTNYIEPKAAHPRTGLGVHLEKMPKNAANQVRDVLRRYGKNISIGDNGGLGSFIYYEK